MTAIKEIEVNGKVYSMWNQFVERQKEWIGGILEDSGDSFDRSMGTTDEQTEITEIKLKPNGKESAWFGVNGKTFSCGFDVGVGGITKGEEGWVTFSGYGGHTWRIKKSIK